MAGKRKRDILDFDPNKSDSNDENFEPEIDRPRSRKKSRPHGVNKSSSRRKGRYRGSDIEDDDIDDSGHENSFDEDDEEEEEPEPLINENTGRRVRKAASKQHNYKESSEDEVEDLVQDSDDDKDDLVKNSPKKSSPRQRKLITLRVPASARKTRAATNTNAPVGTRRITRARTVDEDDVELLELTNSGRHARPTRASKSKSPETLGRSGRPTRSAKGVKKTISPVMEVDTQEEESIPQAEDVKDPIIQDDDALDANGVDQAADDDAAEDQGQEHEEPMETVEANEDADADDDDDVPITRRTRGARANQPTAPAEDVPADDADNVPLTRGRLTRKSRLKKSMQEPSSDFEPGNESGEENMSDSEANPAEAAGDDGENSSPSARGRGFSRSKGGKPAKRSRRRAESGEEDEVDENEVAEELEDLREDSRSRRRRRSPQILFEGKRQETRRRRAGPVNYVIPALNQVPIEPEEDEETGPTPARRRGRANGGATWDHSLHTSAGPFGGVGLTGALLGGPWGTGAAGGADSDSSDNEMDSRSGVAGNVGMTPTSAAPQLAPFGQHPNVEGLGGHVAPTPNVGKIKSHKALADADPLGVDLNVDFSQVGGLQGHIDQLKEMVQLPLLYPELFMKFHVTPPRGVLFHGPPGTGKTLLARALANSVGIGGRKITFYMRKGADALSKWVGEAEKQLRLLFEEARRTQPSIIFFDEIDGLAPVRSSKQEQIHASIVSTLLALMDGMDGRGQVIVIGATNRPDSVDPALRRPGRFDREFYFPLPDVDARKSIIDIHTQGWGLSDEFKTSLARDAKGYGGADLRAMCTEAALNAIQRTYPQIYSSKEKLVVNPDKITVHMTDFILSKNKIIPSSERSATSGASPLPKPIEPLLRDQFKAVTAVLDGVLPRKKKVTALDEAMFEPYDDDDFGFGREALHQEFQRFRVYRPRLLVCGSPGMGQVYVSAAMLHYLEGVHVQNFDLATLLGDPLPVEQVLFQFFAEARRQKPSIIFIPNVDVWYSTLAGPALTAFLSMLRTIPPTDPIMVVGTAEVKLKDIDPDLKRDIFGLSNSNSVEIARPVQENRQEYFSRIISHIRRFPKDFPDPANRKKRVLEELSVAPPPPPKKLTREEAKLEWLRYRQLLNLLKVHLQPIMDQIKRKYKTFRSPLIAQTQYQYLFDEADPNHVRPDVADALPRPYIISKDREGYPGLLETSTNKFYYNLDIQTIEERLANGYYTKPLAFLKDIECIEHDAKNSGDKALRLKANELYTNVEVDVNDVDQKFRAMGVNWEDMFSKEQARRNARRERHRKRMAIQSAADQAQAGVGNGRSPPLGRPARLQKLHTTMAHFQLIGDEANGDKDDSLLHPTVNGTSVPSRDDGDDVTMTDIEGQTLEGPNTSMQPPSQWPRMDIRSIHTSVHVTTGGTNQMSQVSAVQSLPAGVSPSALINDASTTKTSDPSNRSSNFSTQATNGIHNEHSSLLENIPDTQPVPGTSHASSEDQWLRSEVLRGHTQQSGSSQGSRAQASPAGARFSHAPSMANLLNDPSPDEQSQSQRPPGSSASQQVELDETQGQFFLEELTKRTSGCTIEQLQQIYREMMVELWKTRGEHNRMKVLNSVTRVFNEAINDIESMQGFLAPSQTVG
ncbi:AAA-domain-containing protein [Durotheca rogersii]|uniref:AAA-domain-containing protein n=1 Tax=Durotheca rogersii TaxID=419775 RepID=UPI002220721A|nr:AAA-domain-containing protein [Durotheca rogersii]KAI5859368.1 AAA-domain-containing protein [Durotheca rogersii]